MLKPQRKIIRKEIKRDPFLETMDKLEYNFEKNKKTYFNFAVIIVLVVFATNFLLNKQTKKEFDSNSALGIALVAYDNSDYENAKFQFETITAEFPNTNSASISNYYLGKIAYDNYEFNISESYLNKYLNDYEIKILIPGTIKMLSDIAFRNNKIKDAIKVLDEGIKLNLKTSTKIEFELLKALILFKSGDKKSTQKILDNVLSKKSLSPNLKKMGEELLGMM